MRRDGDNEASKGKRPGRRQRGGLLALFFGDVVKAVLVLSLLQGFVFHFSVVRGSSMLPGIHDGDRLLVDRISYSLGDVERFDVVILECPKKKGVDYVKRIIGLPKDKIRLLEGRLFINGERVPERFGHVPDPSLNGSWEVPDASFFVLGDNRPISSDSREGWFVPTSKLRGKVRYCFWPLGHARVYP